MTHNATVTVQHGDLSVTVHPREQERRAPANPWPARGGRPPTVSVVVPTLNEARNLAHVLPRIPAGVHEVILVDGHSTDDTVAVARALRPDVRVVLQERLGKGDALRCGFEAATGSIVVTLDADGSADPAEIPAFVGLLVAGYDFVKGSRFLQGGGTADMELHRRAGNWALMWTTRMAFGGRYSDLCYGYNAFWRDVLPVILPDVDGFEIETLMSIRALRRGLRVAEVPSFEARRIDGVSNLRVVHDGLRVLRTIVRERVRTQQRPTPLALDVVTTAVPAPPPTGDELVVLADKARSA